MLEQLIVKDFALSAKNTLDFNSGMTCITGETGAGKSLTVDALSLLLGARADANMVRTGAQKAELNAVFSIDRNELAKKFLKEHELTSEDSSLMLRRVIGSDGKSKAYINDTPCTLAWLKEIGAMLVAIHGQHASIKLIDKSNQLKLVDEFGSLTAKVKSVDEAFNAYNVSRRKLQDLADEQQQGAANYKNLKYELDALNKLDLKEGDYEQISQDYDSLQHQSQAQDAVSLALGVLENEEHNIIDIISARISDLSRVSVYAKDSIEPIIDDLSKAAEHLDLARDALNDLTLKANPELVEELSEKLSKCHEFARRFEVQPKELYKVKERLEKDLEHFLSLKEQIAELTGNVKKLRDDYEEKCRELSELRQAAALRMSKEVSSKIKDLAMKDGVFIVNVVRDEDCRPRAGGRDDVEFLFSANLGETPKELGAVASGGELSRLALAIEVLTSSANSTPTLIFDEVDTGISGRTASSVGSLLRQLGQSVQVITVTHLPQVAASANQQFVVNKVQEDANVISKVCKLDTDGRIEEISRMMGGNVVTDATRQSALALLKQSGN
ncbi:DNA repair protein RecN [uncultured Succinivibrio sp.]|uniref:DNA repair protein RecN n=1 Tax=uncultured Succinivibrio sp. TaxID=540749 RepID=UPI0025F81A2A|nr:DNA repair protein RecN [uncultured Succinivibrio sp.]